jgi:7-carboxy-7-deazaguanine synthase (Cx14CxxC type)
MTYAVKELYATLQGEGAQTGRAAVFCRFTGCNLWSGLERDRPGAVCQFCDTDFVGTDGPGGGRFSDAATLAAAARRLWDTECATGASSGAADGEGGCAAGDPFVVCTGGEPLLQLDEPLIEAFHALGFAVAVETNGTIAAPAGLDWICVSPKGGARLVQRRGDELKLVYRQPGAAPEEFAGLDFTHFFLQPMDGPDREAHTVAAIRYCLAHPRWRLSVQTHKYLGLR